MAIQRIKQGTKATATSAASIPISFATLPAAGNFVAVLVWGFGTLGFPANGCADNQGVGNTYTRAVFLRDNPRSLEVGIYFCPVIGATSDTFTVTFTPTASGYMVGQLIEFSGVSTSTTPAATQTNTAISADSSSGTANAGSSASRLALALFTCELAQGFITNLGTGTWTEEAEELSLTINPGEGNSQIATATTYECNWDGDTSGTYVSAIAVFDAATEEEEPEIFAWAPVVRAVRGSTFSTVASGMTPPSDPD